MGQYLRLALTLSLVLPAAVLAIGGEEDPTTAAQAEARGSGRFVLVEGQITNHIGGGEAGVSITVRWKGKDGREGDVIGTATTDNFGDFAVKSAEAIRGDIVVTISKPRFATMTHELYVGDDEFPPYLAEMLAGTLVLKGRVVDVLTKEPVAGAVLRLTVMEQDWHAKSDDFGHFTINGIPPGSGTLVAEASGYGRERREIAQLEGSGEILVDLKGERIVHLTIVDDLSKPIAGVTVECYDDRRDDFRAGVTDKSGTVTLKGLHFDTDSLNLRLTHDEHVSDAGFDRQIVIPPDEVKSTHRLVMDRSGKIIGLVTDSGTGEPLNGGGVDS